MLDLGFRSERRFRIRSPFTRLTSVDGWRFDDAGNLTAESLTWLKAEFPGIDWDTRLASVSLRSVRDIVTIDLIVELIFVTQVEDPARV